MNNKIPAYIYSVSNLANEIELYLKKILPEQKISHVNILNIISHASKYKNYQSMKSDNQSFKINNFTGETEEFRTKNMFSSSSLSGVIPEIKSFIQMLRVDLLNGYLILEGHNQYFTMFLAEDENAPKKKTYSHIDCLIDDVDNFLLILKKQINQKFSIDFSLDSLTLIVGNQLMLNIESKTPLDDYKKLFNELYNDVKNDDWFSPKRMYTSYDIESDYFEYGEKIGLIELTLKMIAYQKASDLGFNFIDADCVLYGDDTMLSNQ